MHASLGRGWGVKRASTVGTTGAYSVQPHVPLRTTCRQTVSSLDPRSCGARTPTHGSNLDRPIPPVRTRSSADIRFCFLKVFFTIFGLGQFLPYTGQGENAKWSRFLGLRFIWQLAHEKMQQQQQQYYYSCAQLKQKYSHYVKETKIEVCCTCLFR